MIEMHVHVFSGTGEMVFQHIHGISMPLQAEQLVVGRGPNHDLTIPHEFADVEWHHARLYLRPPKNLWHPLLQVQARTDT